MTSKSLVPRGEDRQDKPQKGIKKTRETLFSLRKKTSNTLIDKYLRGIHTYIYIYIYCKHMSSR